MAAITLTPLVKLSGSPLSTQFLAGLREVKIERELQVPSRVTLRFVDPGYVLAASGNVTLGATVEVSGPEGSPTLVSAEVTGIAVEQPPGDQPEFVVTALDKSHRLSRTMTTKAYQQMSHSDTIQQLARDAGLTAEVDSTEGTFPFLIKADTDLAWLTEVARRNGYDWWVEGSALNFKKPAEDSSPTKLALGDGLVSFSVKATGYHPQTVQVNGWDSSQQSMLSSTASSASDGIAANSDLADLVKSTSTFGSSTLLRTGLSPTTQSEAKGLGQALFDRATSASVVAKGVVIPGDGDIVPGKAVTVSEAGPLSGTYPVSAVEHAYRPATGFVTRFRSGDRRPTSLVDTLGGAAIAPGIVPDAPAVLIGKVTNAKDPDNGGRVQVKYPGRAPEVSTDWARVLGLGGGSNRGSFFVPDVDTEVLVSFEDGDARKPVVLGAVHSPNAVHPTVSAPTTINSGTGNVDVGVIRSRLGHHIAVMDGDGPDQQGIELMLSQSTQQIRLGNDKLTIQVGSGLPIDIKSGDQASIQFAADGSVTIKGTKVTIEGQTQVNVSGPNVSVKGDAQLALQSDAQTSVKGAVVQMQGEGQVAISGAMVQIN